VLKQYLTAGAKGITRKKKIYISERFKCVRITVFKRLYVYVKTRQDFNIGKHTYWFGNEVEYMKA